MSKRISNKRGRSRKRSARSNVRFGWRKTLAQQNALLKKSGVDNE